MNPPTPPEELQRLRRRFVTLMMLQGVLGVTALAFGVAYFALHQAWGLPAFTVALGAALVAQIHFIWKFKNGGS